MKKRNRRPKAAKTPRPPKAAAATKKLSGTENKARGFSRARVFATPTAEQEDMLWKFAERYPDALIPPGFDDR